MENKGLPSVSISSVTENINLSHIDNDLILFDDFVNLPVFYGARRNPELIIGLCLEGSLSFTSDTVDYSLSAGDALIVHEGQVIGNYRPDDGVRGIGIMMSYDFFHEIVKDVHELSSLFIFSRSHPVFRMNPGEIRSVRSYFNLIKEKVDDKTNHFRKNVVRMLISAMICDLSNAIYRIQLSDDRRQTRAEAIFTGFIKLVGQNYRRERRVGWYGGQLCITSKYLSETVKAVSRRTPNEWIDRYVIMELRVQLRNTTKSIKEIACEMNFPNQSSMGKYFKEHVGMSPMMYRKS